MCAANAKGGQGRRPRRPTGWEAAPSGTGAMRPVPRTPAPLPLRASLTKCKFKDKIVETFKAATSEH